MHKYKYLQGVGPKTGIQFSKREFHTYIYLDYVRVEFLSCIKKKLINMFVKLIYIYIYIVKFELSLTVAKLGFNSKKGNTYIYNYIYVGTRAHTYILYLRTI